MTQNPLPFDMMGLSLTQPWASLMGLKEVETRSWSTPYRGPVAFQAAKNFPAWAKQECQYDVFASALRLRGITEVQQLPLGRIVAVGWLRSIIVVPQTGVTPVTLPFVKVKTIPPDLPERRFGNYAPGRRCWIFSHIIRLPRELQPVKLGHQGCRPMSYRALCREQGIEVHPAVMTLIKRAQDKRIWDAE